MTYFDTDVLVNFVYNQDTGKHLESISLVEKFMVDESFSISWLSIQETGFVLAKLKQSDDFITQKLYDLMTFSPLNYDILIFNRGIELANHIGFRDFNDCLHVAIAEQYCTDFYTYNREDFKKIQPLTFLNIHIL